jgi:hypothetical protein
MIFRRGSVISALFGGKRSPPSITEAAEFRRENFQNFILRLKS